MREILYIILLLLLVIGYFRLWRRYRGDFFSMFWISLFFSFIAVFGYKFINVNTTPEDVYNAVKQIVEDTGDDSIVRVNSNDDIEVLIGEEWVVSSDLEILSWATEDIVVEYGGKKIKIMDSGLTSTIKTLDRLGFLD